MFVQEQGTLEALDALLVAALVVKFAAQKRHGWGVTLVGHLERLTKGIFIAFQLPAEAPQLRGLRVIFQQLFKELFSLLFFAV